MYVDIPAHVYQLLKVKIGEIPGFKELMCFKITHTPECRGLFIR